MRLRSSALIAGFAMLALGGIAAAVGFALVARRTTTAPATPAPRQRVPASRKRALKRPTPSPWRTGLAAAVLVTFLATATMTFAAERRAGQAKPAIAPAPLPELTVPDVRGEAYVFAKGMLQDAGFAWRVEGSIQGYAANLVAAQQPAPGLRVLDTGAPTVVLRLEVNESYQESGQPQNRAPYRGTAVRLSR